MARTRKATQAEFDQYSAYVAPRQREKFALYAAITEDNTKLEKAKVIQAEIDQYCFANKICLRRTGVRIVL